MKVDYPSKKHLTEHEAMAELKSGPDPAWFEPAYTRAVAIGHRSAPQATYGLVRIYGDAEPFTYEIELFADREALSWAIGAQWEGYRRRQDESGAAYDVLFFELDQPVRLRMVLELDDEVEGDDDDEAAE